MDAYEKFACGKCAMSVFAAYGKCVSLRKCLVTFYYLSSAGHSYLRGMLGNAVFGPCLAFCSFNTVNVRMRVIVVYFNYRLQCIIFIHIVSFSVISSIID